MQPGMLHALSSRNNEREREERLTGQNEEVFGLNRNPLRQERFDSTQPRIEWFKVLKM